MCSYQADQTYQTFINVDESILKNEMKPQN